MLGPTKLNTQSILIDSYGRPYLSDMVGIFAMMSLAASARIFMVAVLYRGSHRRVRPLGELQIATAMTIPTVFFSGWSIWILVFAVLTFVLCEYGWRQSTIRQVGLPQEGNAPSFTALKVVGWVIGGFPVLVGVFFLPFWFVPALVAMGIWTPRPWSSSKFESTAQAKDSQTSIKASANVGPSDAWQQLTGKEYKAWQAAGEPNLRPWDEAGRPDFMTWLAKR